MKIILDTNVLVSGIFFRSGPPGKIVIAFIEDKIELIITPNILTEYIDVIKRLQHNFPDVNIDQFLNKLLRYSNIHIPNELPFPICRDPKDDKFIACAITSKTKIIVSGDKDLIDISGYHRIEVLKPTQFVSRYLN
ncbi:MAG: putative toxin-antitoxin system toxin component, PIN family [Candidatus Omnitrophica bacterium]|nr:putative toxin-antitoxin system toxin component, PIN family [Candidatus Omnitrophota bacterium]